MSYQTPKTDWMPTDYFNIVDWTRIYENSLLVHELMVIDVGTFQFDILAAPTVNTIPNITNLNLFIGNIERMRFVMDDNLVPGFETEIKDDYIAGAGQVAPKYSDANLWESVIDLIWNFYDGPLLPVCPTLSIGLTIVTGVNAVYIDCIDAANFDIDVQGTANLYIL